MDEYEGRIEWMNYLSVIWKRKWLVIISTFLCALAAGVFSFLQPPVWEVDAIIQGGKFFDKLRHEEVWIAEGEQTAGQINEGYFDNLIAADLNMNVKEMPKLKVKNLRWTQLVQVSIRANDVEKAKLILHSLFNHVKRDLDKKIDSEIKSNVTQVEHMENIINMENFSIQSREIEISKIKKEILSGRKKLKESEERQKNIIDEMNKVQERIDEIGKQQRKALTEKKEGSDTLSLLLYSNKIQNYFRSYYTLDQKLSAEKLTQEQIREFTNETEAHIRLINTEIERSRRNIEISKKEINLLNEAKSQIDHTQFIKEPTSSLYPVAPRKKLNIFIGGVLGLFVFSLFAFFLEYVEKLKLKE